MASYTLDQHLVGQGLLDAFTFFDAPDPSNGFVNYQDYTSAVASGLVSVNAKNQVKLGVDSNNTYDINTDIGRPSVRLTSNEVFNGGLFIADFNRVPASTCGSWPAFWAVNNEGNWPVGGEFDIIEGQNDAERNLFAAHTETGCSVVGSGIVGVPCSLPMGTRMVTLSTPWAAGSMPWLTPDPSTWGKPQALFGGPSGSSCETNKFFFNMSLAINIDFCGDYAGTFWNQSSCSVNHGPSCSAFVAENPSEFANLFWDINYIDTWSRPDNTTTLNGTTAQPPTNTTTPFTRVTIVATDPSAMPTGANGGFIDDATIDGYTLLGCFGSPSGYQSFEPFADLPDMDNDVCVESCRNASKKYAGTVLTTCYCADALGDAVATDNNRCNIPCPGCDLETCGGYVNGSAPSKISTGGFNSTNPDNTTSILPRGKLNRRVAPADLLLTIYGNITADISPAPPGIGGVNGTGPSTVTSSAAVTITTAITVTYTTVCATNAAELVTLEYCTTLTIENCPSGTPVSGLGFISPANDIATPTAVPMTTYVETCKACGAHGESTITLTIPEAVATGGPDVVVTAFVVATVRPLINESNVSASNGSAGPAQLPVLAGADSLVGTVAWGVLMWLGVFSIMLAM
ncbi:mixed-linked glucanase [Seiridium cupressi]